MDYCSTCRRHLNGALVCPGCGAYAPDIAPVFTGGHTASGAADVRPGDGTAMAAAGTDTVPSDEVAHAMSAPSGTGRAARRRQRVRWKKTQRRALVATAVALVGGGLTLVSTDRGTGDRTQATAAPDLKGMGGAKGPADGYGDPDTATPAADPTSQSPSADDDGRHRPAEDAPAPTAPSRTSTDGAVAAQPAVASPHRTASPDTGSGTRSDPTAGTDTGSGTGSATDGSGTVTRPAPPAADDNDGTGSDSGTDSGADQGGTQPAPSTPPTSSPDAPSQQLCLLVICLGGR
ncbi:SCO2400 family protein [Streptomyces griseoloalbus]|uniref:Uncharacterized protein n=1 Tax=Streptomyces griseoloalbus TaxID=67303 RepID=A0A7W8BX11_9ACTN|nr:hypothetical protein [Streptomyces albaduncus]MBB5129748.1 hypothetical protein [Streptomyces albaduncus]GGW62686.1 hypothetical protein GCM10010340_46300 [Streptomyces albaduncus]